MKKLSLVLLSLAFLMTLYITPISVHATTLPSGAYFDNVVTILMENEAECAILYNFVTGCGNSAPNAPFLTKESQNYGLATHYVSADGTTPSGCSTISNSQPNYIALTSGQIPCPMPCSAGSGCQSPTADCAPNTTTCNMGTTRNIIDMLSSAGASFVAYAENYPASGGLGCYTSGDTGNFAGRHFPFNYYTDITGNSTRCAQLKLANTGNGASDDLFLNALTSTAPNFMWLTPNLCNDMHGGSGCTNGCTSGGTSCIAPGDNYLHNLVTMILNSQLFTTKRAALFIVFDEGGGTCPSGGSGDCVYAVWLGPTAQKGFLSNTAFNHYSWLKTLEANWNLPSLTSNDSGATGMGAFFTIVPAIAPLLGGWGGPRLKDVNQNFSAPLSNVFMGEGQSDFEQETLQLSNTGYNTVRASFAPYCSVLYGLNSKTSPPNFEGDYNATQLTRAINIARHYNMFIVVDYHGFADFFNSTLITCWHNFWSGVITQFKNNYTRIVWEPLNEPNNVPGSTDLAKTAVLSSSYQNFINLARSLGDTHYVIVQNLCSFGCAYSSITGRPNSYLDFPSVNDTFQRIYESYHTYIDYPTYSATWGNATSDTVAKQDYQIMLNQTAWPSFSSEGGTACGSGCPYVGTGGSVGYSVASFHYIQSLVNLEDNNAPRFGHALWVDASWADRCYCLYGSIESWGSILSHKSFTATPTLTVQPSSYRINCPNNVCPQGGYATIGATVYMVNQTNDVSVTYTPSFTPGTGTPFITGPLIVTLSPSTNIVTWHFNVTFGSAQGTFHWTMTTTRSTETLSASFDFTEICSTGCPQQPSP